MNSIGSMNLSISEYVPRTIICLFDKLNYLIFNSIFMFLLPQNIYSSKFGSIRVSHFFLIIFIYSTIEHLHSSLQVRKEQGTFTIMGARLFHPVMSCVNKKSS